MPLETVVIEHCAPTLANLKIGGMFSFDAPHVDLFYREVDAFNRCLAAKGIELIILRLRDGRALCYLYRRSALRMMLRRAEERAFLRAQGYNSFSVEDALATLRMRIVNSASFPHEVGLFLGYPLRDVIGFIQNGGRNCLCCGCWKVYTDLSGAMRTFARFKRCTCVYKRLYQSGRTLTQLTVAA